MSLESKLFTELAALCPRVFPDVAPAGTARPYVTYQQIGGDPSFYVEGQVMAKVSAYMQINVWHESRQQANTLMRQIEAALLQSTAFQAEPQGGLIAGFEEDTETRSAQQDFSIWADR